MSKRKQSKKQALSKAISTQDSLPPAHLLIYAVLVSNPLWAPDQYSKKFRLFAILVTPLGGEERPDLSKGTKFSATLIFSW
jgi:hypothetical protein